MAERTDTICVAWVKLRGSNCPAYPVTATVAELPVFLAQLDPGDAILVSRPMEEGGVRLPDGDGRDAREMRGF